MIQCACDIISLVVTAGLLTQKLSDSAQLFSPANGRTQSEMPRGNVPLLNKASAV